MNTRYANRVKERIIKGGRAAMRFLEVVDLLLCADPVWTERFSLQMVQALYTHRLRRLVAALPADITDEILATDRKATSLVMGFSQN